MKVPTGNRNMDIKVKGVSSFVINLVGTIIIATSISIISSSKTLANSGSPLVVPSSTYPTITDAIRAVADGGIIEILPGTYQETLRIENLNKSFILRAKQNNTVNLTANGTSGILRIVNGKPVTLEGLNIINGVSNVDGLAGGLTINRGQVTLVKCKFIGNGGFQPTTGGGALLIFNRSKVFIVDSFFVNNAAKNSGGAIEIQDNSAVYIDNATFTENKVNIPYHRVTSAGGAVHIGNSTVFISDSYFGNNQAGYVGGAVFVIGTWKNPYESPQAQLMIINSKFEKNAAIKDASVGFYEPTGGGGVHAEDQSLLRIYNSRFIENFADIGGAVTGYRSKVEIYDSAFMRNKSTMFGGVISVTSNDTPNDPINYPPGNLIVKDSYIEGLGLNSPVAESAGGVYVSGDVNRMYGINGVSQQGDATQNRAMATIENVVFRNNNVAVNEARSHAGALMVDFGALTLRNSLFLLNRAYSGGAVSLIQGSQAEISGCDFFQNAAKYGGALYVAGANIRITNSNFVENSLFDVGQNANVSFGAALYIAPMDQRNINATGIVENNIFSANIGLPIYDRDNMTSPINEVIYNKNKFFTEYFGSSVYTNSNPYQCCKTVDQLNALVITRNNGSTKKSQEPNSSLSVKHIFGKVIAAPRFILPAAEVSHQDETVPSMISYVCSGQNATLNNNQLPNRSGSLPTLQDGIQRLTCDTVIYEAMVGKKVPLNGKVWVAKNNYNTYVLRWETNLQSPFKLAFDQGINIGVNSSQGELTISPENTYLPIRLFILSDYQGKVISTPKIAVPQNFTALVGLNQNPEDRVVRIPLMVEGGSTIGYSVERISNSEIVEVLNTQGVLADNTSIELRVLTEHVGIYPIQLHIVTDIDQELDINGYIQVVENVFSTFIPILSK